MIFDNNIYILSKNKNKTIIKFIFVCFLIKKNRKKLILHIFWRYIIVICRLEEKKTFEYQIKQIHHYYNKLIELIIIINLVLT